MTGQLSDQFDTFLDSVTPSIDERRSALQQAKAVAETVSRYSDIERCLITGSMTRSTAIRRYSDVDIVAVIKAKSGLSQADPAALVSTLARRLRETEPDVQIFENAVRVVFNVGVSVDVLPAIHIGRNGTGDDVYRIGAAAQNGWQTYIPEDQNRVVERATQSFGENYKRLVRLCKWWSKTHGRPISSYEIERAAFMAFSKRIPNLPLAMIDFLDYAAHSMERDRGSVNIIEKSRSIAQEACASWNADDVARSTELWRYLLGDDFPAIPR